jgi:hypothetical protein
MILEEQTDDVLERQLNRYLLADIDECKRLGYNPTAYRLMLAEYGAVGALRRLLRPPAEHCSEGFVRLCLPEQLDLAAEYPVAFEPRFESLFTDKELTIARERLAIYRVTGPRS